MGLQKPVVDVMVPGRPSVKTRGSRGVNCCKCGVMNVRLTAESCSRLDLRVSITPQESGLSLWVARLMTPLGDLPVLATVTIACLIVTTLTEVTSNAATITIFLPILSPLAEAIHVNPLYILIPATLCTSFSFLLPVSNPPNAVVYAYGHITIMDMVKAGLGVNTIGVLALLLAMATWGIPLFSLDTYPEWAPTFNSTTP